MCFDHQHICPLFLMLVGAFICTSKELELSISISKRLNRLCDLEKQEKGKNACFPHRTLSLGIKVCYYL